MAEPSSRPRPGEKKNTQVRGSRHQTGVKKRRVVVGGKISPSSPVLAGHKGKDSAKRNTKELKKYTTKAE